MMPAVQLGVLRRAGLPRPPAGGGFPLACGSPLKEWVREGPHDAGRLVQGAGDGEERTPCFCAVAGVPQLVIGDVELAGQDETASLGFGFQRLLLGVGLHGDLGQDRDQVDEILVPG